MESPSNGTNRATPLVVGTEETEEDELVFRKQWQSVRYIDDLPRRAVIAIELLSPTYKEISSVG